jgi:hypothetical protein
VSISIELRYELTWRSNIENGLYSVKYSKSQCRRVNAEVRSNVATLPKLKRNEVARINLVQDQVKEKYFIFNLEYMNTTLSSGISYGLSIKSQCST